MSPIGNIHGLPEYPPIVQRSVPLLCVSAVLLQRAREIVVSRKIGSCAEKQVIVLFVVQHGVYGCY